jgi:hypothetical protein
LFFVLFLERQFKLWLSSDEEGACSAWSVGSVQAAMCSCADLFAQTQRLGAAAGANRLSQSVCRSRHSEMSDRRSLSRQNRSGGARRTELVNKKTVVVVVVVVVVVFILLIFSYIEVSVFSVKKYIKVTER